jgi:virginiamycin B lyase
MRRTAPKIAFFVCCVVLLPAGLRAQYPKVAKQQPGRLDGEVVSSKGVPVSGAQIMWQAADGETPHVLHSDAQGHFHIDPLRAGLYELRASVNGTWSEWEHNVMVRPGVAANVTLRLTFKAPPVAAALQLKGAMRTWDAPVPGAMPHDPAADPKGNIWFTLQETGHLARFNPDTHEWKLFKVPTPHSGPQGLVSDAGGNIWFTENYVGKIGRVDAKSGLIAEYIPHSGKDPHTPALGPDGGVWFTAPNSNIIGRVDIETRKITEFEVPTQDAHPYGIVLGDDGGLWFCESTGQKLGRVDPASGAITEFGPEGAPDSDHAPSKFQPHRLVAVSGAIYFTDFSGGRLGRLTLADKKFNFWDSPSGIDSKPDGIAVDSTGKIWYEESAESANKLVRFDPAVEIFNSFPMPDANASVFNIARDARGRLWMPLSLPNKIAIVE